MLCGTEFGYLPLQSRGMKIQVLRKTEFGDLPLQSRQTKIQVLRETEFGYLKYNQDKRNMRR